MEYPKIHTIWKREDPKLPGSKGRGKIHSLIEGDYSCSEFASFKTWRVEEKIDGTNIRIIVNCGEGTNPTIEVKGRTEKANLHPDIIKYVSNLNLLPILNEWSSFILFGEGFGAGIQSGGIYRKDISFILFDVYMNGRWSTREEVKRFADLLEMETPKDFGLMTQEEIISFVKSKPQGKYNDTGYIMEGIIARSEPLVRFNDRSANPVMWKLKVKDFDM